MSLPPIPKPTCRTEFIVLIQIRLCPNGDFVTRSNEVETVRRRMTASESYLQIFTMTEDGTVTVSKFGHIISRTTNDVIRLDGVIVNH